MAHNQKTVEEVLRLLDSLLVKIDPLGEVSQSMAVDLIDICESAFKYISIIEHEIGMWITQTCG